MSWKDDLRKSTGIKKTSVYEIDVYERGTLRLIFNKDEVDKAMGDGVFYVMYSFDEDVNVTTSCEILSKEWVYK